MSDYKKLYSETAVALLLQLVEVAIERYGDDYQHSKYVGMAKDLNKIRRMLSEDYSV